MALGTKTDRDVRDFKGRLKGVLKKQLGNVLQNQPVISNRKAIVKIPYHATTLPPQAPPLPNMPPPRNISRQHPWGQTRPGDLVGRTPRNDGSGTGSKGGSDAGEHFIEVWMSEEELWELIQEEWKLPDLLPQKAGDVPEYDPEWTRRGTVGDPSRLLRRRTIYESLKHDGVIHNEDRRYRRVTWTPRPTTQAVVYLVRDVSGSMMDPTITEWIRLMGFVLTLWLSQQYPEVQIEFITYETFAKQVPETEFFGTSAGGGTMVSKALELVQDLQDTHYPPADWQQYFYCWTDGEDFQPDMLTDWLNKYAGTFQQQGWMRTFKDHGYGSGYTPDLFTHLKEWRSQNTNGPVVICTLSSAEEVPTCLQTLFSTQNATNISDN